MKASTIKQILRSLLGDKIASWIHAFRFGWMALYGKLNKDEEELDILLIPALVNPGDIVVDIGANGADWTTVLSHRVGDQGHVFAFEADPYYAEVTRKTIKLLRLNNVTFFPFGLSDKNETTFLQVLGSQNERLSGTGRIVHDSAPQSISPEKCVAVKLEALDTVAQSHPLLMKTRLIKCDVEGFELMVFQGAINILKHARPIVIAEIGGAESHGYSNSEIFDFFQGLDYHCYVAVSEKLVRPSTQPGSIPEGARPNRIMIPKEWHLNSELITVETDD